MRIAIVTDAWRPQVNGVVTTLTRTGEALTADGHEVRFITPEEHPTVPLPTYREIRLAVFPYRRVAASLDAFCPDAIHIATEGPLGHAARRYCRRRGLPFTTAWHTQFPRYVRLRAPVPERWTYAWLRRFHGAAERTLVPTASMRDELLAHGFRNVVLWSRGVDTAVFHPRERTGSGRQRPICLFVGRVAAEKNLEAFLGLILPGTRVVVGDGPDRERLARRYPDAEFPGYRFGDALAQEMAAADVFVFPSRTDTFGLTMLEAMACGTPVAAFPVTGPRDVVVDGVTGALDDNLRRAVMRALEINREDCAAHAARHTWQTSARTFAGHLAPIPGRLGVRSPAADCCPSPPAP